MNQHGSEFSMLWDETHPSDKFLHDLVLGREARFGTKALKRKGQTRYTSFAFWLWEGGKAMAAAVASQSLCFGSLSPAT